MNLDHLKVEGNYSIEESLSSKKLRLMLRLILQALLNGGSRLRHVHTSFFAAMYL